MKLLPLLLIICLDCGAQRDTVYVTDTIKYKDGGYRINLSDGNYRVTFPGGKGGYGSGAYKNLPVILPKKDIKDAGGIGSGFTVTEVKDTSRAILSDASGKLTVVEYRNIWHWVMKHRL